MMKPVLRSLQSKAQKKGSHKQINEMFLLIYFKLLQSQ